MAAVKRQLAQQGLGVADAYEVILQAYGLAFIRQPLLRSLLMDGLTFLPGLHYMMTHARGKALLRLALQQIQANVKSGLMRLYLLRNFVKKIGVYCLLQRLQQRQDLAKTYDVVLWDEGVLHIAHMLFVHADHPPNLDAMHQFNQLTLHSDLSVWVAANPERSIQCTLRRGHRRVRSNPESARHFVEHACQAFDVLFGAQEVVTPSAQLLKVYIPDQGRQPYEAAVRQISQFLTRKVVVST